MAKFGQLFLDGGEWNGQRIISEQWVNTSTQQRVDLNAEATLGYGYQWWMGQFASGEQTLNTFYANGYGGQFIFIFPQIELVVVFTGDAYLEGEAEERSIRTILEQSILPVFTDS